MRIENFPKPKRSDHRPKRDEFIDVSSDPPYFSLDSPFKVRLTHSVDTNTTRLLWAYVLKSHLGTNSTVTDLSLLFKPSF
jgi:hypothetical protein